MGANSLMFSEPRVEPVAPRGVKYSAAEIQTLKERDNTTNIGYLAGVYAVIAATIVITVGS